MKVIKLTNSCGTMLVNVATIQKVYIDLDKRTKVQLIGMEHYFVVKETIEEIFNLINN
jgi:DNA-binding transcriptional regulator YhcF (GntR family)